MDYHIKPTRIVGCEGNGHTQQGSGLNPFPLQTLPSLSITEPSFTSHVVKTRGDDNQVLNFFKTHPHTPGAIFSLVTKKLF